MTSSDKSFGWDFNRKQTLGRARRLPALHSRSPSFHLSWATPWAAHWPRSAGNRLADCRRWVRPV